MANRKKQKKKEILENRPEVVVGNEQSVVAKNLAMLQDLVGLTNEEMADAFGVSPTHYERLKNGKSALTYDKLMILYYNFGADLNRIICDDTHHTFFRELPGDKPDVDYRVAIRDLMVDISHTNGNGTRKQKIMEAYAAFGEMLGSVLDSNNMKPNS